MSEPGKLPASKKLRDMIADEDLTFEEGLAKLEEIVSRLEEGELGLDESLTRFEDGVRLVRYLSHRLSESEKKVEILMEDEETGQLRVEDFEQEAG